MENYLLLIATLLLAAVLFFLSKRAVKAKTFLFFTISGILNILAFSIISGRVLSFHEETAILLIVVVSSAAFGFLATAIMAKPLKALLKAAKEYSKGNLGYKSEAVSYDELGQLTEYLRAAAEKQKGLQCENSEYGKKLEREVRAKTEEIKSMLAKTEKDKIELQKQKLATLNVLEDVSESQKKLEEMNKALKKKSQQLSSLKRLGDELTGVFYIEEAILTLIQYLKGLIKYTTATFLVLNPTQGGIVYKAFASQPVSEAFLRSVREDIAKFLKNDQDEKLRNFLPLIESISPELEQVELDNSRQKNFGSKIIFPMRIGNYTLGLIHLASVKPDLGGSRRELTDAMVATFSLSVARLHMLITAQQSKTLSLVESLDDGVIMYDDNREVILTNPAICRIMKVSEENFNLNDFISLFKGIDIKKSMKESLTKGANFHFPEYILDKSYYELYIGPIKDDKEKISGGKIILHDITHSKEVDKMKTEFVSIASHQLRTPLTAIKLFTEMLLSGEVGKVSPDQEDYLKNIFQSSERMVRLVNDLLSLSRLESGRLRVEPEKVDLSEYLANIIDEVKPMSEARNVKVIMPKIKEKYEVAIDTILTRQVMNNILTNAIRYSNPRDAEVRISIQKKSKEYVFVIKDNGIGIPPEKQARIFEKFFRADNAVKKETEGSGLGLYVCRMIAENTGSRIWFESSGRGTTFFFSVPAAGMKRKEGEKTLPKAGGNISFS